LWFEAKFDGFRVAASRNCDRMRRFEEVFDLLPKGHVFDRELAVLDDPPRAAFGRERPPLRA
jgi:hypothetical protein